MRFIAFFLLVVVVVFVVVVLLFLLMVLFLFLLVLLLALCFCCCVFVVVFVLFLLLAFVKQNRTRDLITRVKQNRTRDLIIRVKQDRTRDLITRWKWTGPGASSAASSVPVLPGFLPFLSRSGFLTVLYLSPHFSFHTTIHFDLAITLSTHLTGYFPLSSMYYGQFTDTLLHLLPFDLTTHYGRGGY